MPLTLTALGVVYGDIGTSPLYAIRECFFGSHAVPPTFENVLGVLSLIIYALVLVISIKYVLIVMRADNQGEGGILALTALVPGKGRERIGASRLAVGRPILIALGIFGPIVIIWFLTIAALGIIWIVRAPAVMGAFDPRHAWTFFAANGFAGFAVLGAVFLVVTGGEALYADMGHFGRRPIRLAWFSLVLPALVINYLGQGALVLLDPQTDHPFFRLAPSWALLPLVGISTAAAIIASQALISGSFSITRQAIQLGLAPRLDVEHTSAREMGQIYVPQVNWALMIATVLIVVGFGSSGAVASAYGIAVTLTMVITVLLLYIVATERWGWPTPATLAVMLLFLTIDLAFFGANALKLLQGGWVTLAVATILFTLMTTWKTGRRLVAERLAARALPLSEFVATVEATRPVRVQGTAVFMTAQPTGTPPALVHNMQYNRVLHERVVILTVSTAQRPHVPDEERVATEPIGHHMFNVRVQYGFMEDPDVPEALAQARQEGLDIDLDDVTYFLGRETIIVARRKGMAIWREKLFVLMARNAVRATAFFRLPPERVVELGVQVEM